MSKKSARKGNREDTAVAPESLVEGRLHQVYAAWHFEWNGIESIAGFLVARNNVKEASLNSMKLLAFVHINHDETHAEKTAFELAQRVADDPDYLEYRHGPWIDLSECGSIDSIKEIPDFLHGMQFREVPEDRRLWNDDELDGPSFPLEVFCPVRFERMKRQHAELVALQGRPAQALTTPAAAESSPTSATVTPEDDRYEQREDWYTPHLAEWSTYPNVVSEDGRTLAIHGWKNGREGDVIATVTAAGMFSAKDARRMATLMASAPELFRCLRSMSHLATDNMDSLEDFNNAVKVMFEAIDRYPFAFPDADHSEDDILSRTNNCRGRYARHENGKITPAPADVNSEQAA